jgi:hypothetical protein
MQNTPSSKVCFFSGDGGNRTRVRKNRPADIYERSHSLVLAVWLMNDNESHQASHWDPKAPLSHG